MKYDKIIFVCSGNTCRSPMAEALLKHLAIENSDLGNIDICSRGLYVSGPDQLNPRAFIVLRNHDLSADGFKSLNLLDTDITENTLILTMTGEHATKIKYIYPGAYNVYPIKNFVGLDGDVQDPYGGSLDVYEECFSELSDLMELVVSKL